MRPFIRKKIIKSCKFCAGELIIDYKKPEILKQFLTERGKILPAEITNVCAKHQRKLAQAIKRARMLGLLPFFVY